MAVYVDDARIPAGVPNGSRTIVSTWSHLFADTEDELHEFAARLGLQRRYFQRPKNARPESLHAQMWHYDVTVGKREQAIRLGAIPVTRREGSQIIRARHARLYPEAAAQLEERTTAAMARLTDGTG